MRSVNAGRFGGKPQSEVLRTGVSRPPGKSPSSAPQEAPHLAPVPTLPLGQVLLGDCLNVLQTLPAASVDLVFADPPYNLQLGGDLTRPDQSAVDGVDAGWDKFASFADYDAFTSAWLRAVARVMKPTATLFVIGSYHNIFRVGTQLQDLGFWILNDIVWRKTNPMPNFRGRRFTNAHETLIWAAREHKAKGYTFNYEALKAGNEDRQLRSDWLFPLCTGHERLKNAAGEKAHPTQKPEALLERILLAATKAGDVVLDPFFGTGTTGAVAKRLHRHFIGIEREEAYVALARARIDAVTPLLHESVAPFKDKRSEPRIAFASLVACGLVPAGVRLFDAARRHEAVVRADGALQMQGIVGSIHKLGALAQGLPACNGWMFWHIEHNGALAVLDGLRQEFRTRFLALGLEG